MPIQAPRFHHRAIPIVLAAVVIDVIGFGIVMPVLPALVTQLGHMELEAATRVAGWLLAVFAVAQFFAGPVLGHLGDRFGRRPVLIAAMLGFSLDYLLNRYRGGYGLFGGGCVAGEADCESNEKADEEGHFFSYCLAGLADNNSLGDRIARCNPIP